MNSRLHIVCFTVLLEFYFKRHLRVLFIFYDVLLRVHVLSCVYIPYETINSRLHILCGIASSGIYYQSHIRVVCTF